MRKKDGLFGLLYDDRHSLRSLILIFLICVMVIGVVGFGEFRLTMWVVDELGIMDVNLDTMPYLQFFAYVGLLVWVDIKALNLLLWRDTHAPF